MLRAHLLRSIGVKHGLGTPSSKWSLNSGRQLITKLPKMRREPSSSGLAQSDLPNLGFDISCVKINLFN
jgi:hypothetical protein